MGATLHSESGQYDIAAPADLVSGDIFELGPRAVVYNSLKPASSGDLVNVVSRGNFNVDSASATTFSVGDIVEYDSSDGLAVDTGGDFEIGFAIKGKVAGELSVLVALNEQITELPA